MKTNFVFILFFFFFQQISMLMKATSDDDNPIPGYLYDDVNSILLYLQWSNENVIFSQPIYYVNTLPFEKSFYFSFWICSFTISVNFYTNRSVDGIKNFSWENEIRKLSLNSKLGSLCSFFTNILWKGMNSFPLICSGYNTKLHVCLFVWVYGISTFVGYLMPNPFLYK